MPDSAKFILNLEQALYRKRRNFSASGDSIALIIEVYFKIDYIKSIELAKLIRELVSVDKYSFYTELSRLFIHEGLLKDEGTLEAELLSKLLATQSAPNLDQVIRFDVSGAPSALDFFRQHYAGIKVHEGQIALHDPALAKALSDEGAFQSGAVRSLEQVIDERKAAIAKVLHLPEGALDDSQIAPKIASAILAEAVGLTTVQGKWVDRVDTVEMGSKPIQSAPVLWAERQDISQTPIAFVVQNYPTYLMRGVLSRELFEKIDPELAKALPSWKRDRLATDKSFSFIIREYAGWYGLGVTRSDIRRFDKPLYEAVSKAITRGSVPSEFELPASHEFVEGLHKRQADHSP